MNFWSKIQILLAKVKQKSALQIFIGVQEGLQKSFWTKICIIQKNTWKNHFPGFWLAESPQKVILIKKLDSPWKSKTEKWS